MGYSTEFEGSFTVEPPLSAAEVDYLKKYAATRHCEHQPGPYAADGDFGCPGHGSCGGAGYSLPSLWCDWEPNGDGTEIAWNGTEKFHDADVWIKWIIDHLLGPEASANLGPAEGRAPELRRFTCDHVLNGTVNAQGDDPDDRWQIVIADNVVMRREALMVEFGEATPI
jgi:hypothetical protein